MMTPETQWEKTVGNFFIWKLNLICESFCSGENTLSPAASANERQRPRHRDGLSGQTTKSQSKHICAESCHVLLAPVAIVPCAQRHRRGCNERMFDGGRKKWQRKSERNSPSKLISKMLSDSRTICASTHRSEIIIELLIFDVIDNKRCSATFETRMHAARTKNTISSYSRMRGMKVAQQHRHNR